MRNNRLFLLVFALIAGLSSFAMTFYAARENRNNSAPPPPDGLIALNDPLDLGDVPQDIIDGTFELANKSKTSVRIVWIDHSCRCTEVEVPGKNITSGETVKISFKWDTTGVRGVRGSNFTFFYENQSRLHSLVVSVRGNILPQFDLQPESLEFIKDKSETKRVKLIPHNQDSNIIFEKIANALAAFQVEKLSDREIAITYIPKDYAGNPDDASYIALTTNFEKERQCGVFVYVRDPISKKGKLP
jgi:hypothetical protein